MAGKRHEMKPSSVYALSALSIIWGMGCMLLFLFVVM